MVIYLYGLVRRGRVWEASALSLPRVYTMKRELLTILVAAVMAAPVGAATWYGFGTYEPDTDWDDASVMQQDADQDPNAKRIYFNTYQSEYLTGQNANSGALGSRVSVAGLNHWMAVFGAFKDCNGDGYVGFAESALLTYRTELLRGADDICPAGLTPHNDGQWVYEYIPVGYDDEATQNRHPVQIVDEEARVWGDIGEPGDVTAATCPIAPLPHGTTAGTGWAIRYGDCFAGKRVTTTVNENDPNNDLGLFFEDPNNPQYSNSTLNQHLPESLFGNPATGETGALQLDSDEDDASYDKANPQGSDPDYAFTTWDCSGRTGVSDPTGLAPSTISIDDPTYDGQNGALFGNYGKFEENLSDGNGHYAWVANPAPAVHDPSASFADGVNETFRGFRVGGGHENYDTTVGGDCDEVADDQDGDNTYSGVHQTAFFYADGNHEGGTQVKNKKAADVDFSYFNGAETDGAYVELFGPNTPNSLVTTPTTYWYNDPQWSANVVYVTTPQSVNRNTLQFSGPAYWTFYATVGASTFAAGYTAPAGETGQVYGKEACGLSAGTPGALAANGWECDPDLWYTDSNGQDIASRWEVRVGATFHLRDVDCNDGGLVRGVGVHASGTELRTLVNDPQSEPACIDGSGQGPLG